MKRNQTFHLLANFMRSFDQGRLLGSPLFQLCQRDCSEGFVLCLLRNRAERTEGAPEFAVAHATAKPDNAGVLALQRPIKILLVVRLVIDDRFVLNEQTKVVVSYLRRRRQVYLNEVSHGGIA